MADIKFGTDGWRAIVGEDFTKENVELVSRAIGKYVFDNYGIYKTIIIGYDPRNMADEFSMLCAQTLANLGFKILYSDKVVPTPVLAFNAKYLDACAIMFTASHNPPEYLGIKFIPDYAGPATKEITDEIVSNIGCEFETNVKGKLIMSDFSNAYFKKINQIIDFEKIKTGLKNTHILFDGLYSSSIGYFDKLLSSHDIKFDSIHMYHDPNFGGGMPEPKPQYMGEAIEYVKFHNTPLALGEGKFALEGGYVAFANDGDADRFGVINENGEYVTPNEVMAILLMHLKQNKGYEGCFVKTVAGSLMLDIVAQKLGVEVVETAVGFKHVGEAMRKYNPIIAGEESGGLSIQGHIPEKDGILANLLILEAMAYNNISPRPLGEVRVSLAQMQKDLRDFVGCEFINTRVDKRLDNMDEVKPTIEKFAQMSEIAGMNIIRKDDKDGIKLYLEDNKTWILVRASGTEPLLRIYIESDSQDKIKMMSDYICSMV